jgi:GH15 family glucan-1,4-alpha-glucosidase
MDLYRHSIEVIKKNQYSSGAFIACPNFSTYHYCWLRDGSYIAASMDSAGEFASAEAYFRWVGTAVMRYADKLETIREHLNKGLALGKDDFLHTRFTLDGKEDTIDAEWGNFQIDGYGTWLWALAEHVRKTGDRQLLYDLADPINITLQYLQMVWMLPNYDCWEEHPEYVHPYTLANVYGGVNAIAGLVKDGYFSTTAVDLEALKSAVHDYLMQFGIVEGRFAKLVVPAKASGSPKPLARSGVDASLLGIAIPFNVLPLEDPLIIKTIEMIEKDLHRPEGGVYRYKEDVYYGGGEWILLSAWLGIYYAQTGQIKKAKDLLHWIEEQVDDEGSLAEQMSEHSLHPDQLEPWVNKWGPIARPLLWSHAMYILLKNAIDGK